MLHRFGRILGCPLTVLCTIISLAVHTEQALSRDADPSKDPGPPCPPQTEDGTTNSSTGLWCKMH